MLFCSLFVTLSRLISTCALLCFVFFVFFLYKIFYAKKHTGFTTNSARLIKRCLPGNEQTNKAVKKKNVIGLFRACMQ